MNELETRFKNICSDGQYFSFVFKCWRVTP